VVDGGLLGLVVVSASVLLPKVPASMERATSLTSGLGAVPSWVSRLRLMRASPSIILRFASFEVLPMAVIPSATFSAATTVDLARPCWFPSISAVLPC